MTEQERFDAHEDYLYEACAKGRIAQPTSKQVDDFCVLVEKSISTGLTEDRARLVALATVLKK